MVKSRIVYMLSKFEGYDILFSLIKVMDESKSESFIAIKQKSNSAISGFMPSDRSLLIHTNIENFSANGLHYMVRLVAHQLPIYTSDIIRFPLYDRRLLAFKVQNISKFCFTPRRFQGQSKDN